MSAVSFHSFKYELMHLVIVQTLTSATNIFFSFSAKNLSMHKCVQVDTSRRGYSINKFFATEESKKGKGSLVYI